MEPGDVLIHGELEDDDDDDVYWRSPINKGRDIVQFSFCEITEMCRKKLCRKPWLKRSALSFRRTRKLDHCGPRGGGSGGGSCDSNAIVLLLV